MKRGRTIALCALALVVASISIGAAGSPAGADTDDEAAEQAAREISAARDRANAAAAAFFDAQSELEQLGDRAAELAAENTRLQQEVDALQTQVEQVAVNRFVASGSSGIPLLTGYREPSDQLQADVLVGIATESSADAMDVYDQARVDLEANQHEVAANQEAVEEQQELFLALQAAAEEEVERLQAVEAKRLEDERVRELLAAQRREEQRQREAEAAAAAERAAQDRAAQAAQAAQAAAAAPDPAPAAQAVASPAVASSQQAPAAPAPAPTDQGDTSSSDADEGDGGGDAPAAPPPPPAPVSGIICPVAGSSAYSDTWGASRSGGRSHQGVDLLASTGTPLVAVVTGGVQFKHNSLGGNAVWLAGSDGNRYYYAHLSSFEGSSRGVSQGEVIGYVGDTGNARGTPHLHFEVHPGGGAAVNPYPWVRNAGC